MARVISGATTPRFKARLAACKVAPGSRASRALGATIAALADAEVLPSPLDALALVPPTREAFVRRVPGHNLWVWYRLDEAGDVVLVTLTTTPPTPA